MANNDHELLANRLAAILLKLNDGECLNIDQLATEFGVHRRTIQRDIQDRFAFLPLEKLEAGYAIDRAYLGKISFRDIERFAKLAGLKGLFPGLDTQFFRELFDSRLQDTLGIHGVNREDIQHRKQDFRLLQSAIAEHRIVRFYYTKPSEQKAVEVDPYRLINHDGVWYLAAVDTDKPKAYALGRISAIEVQAAAFTPDLNIQHMLDQEDSIWLNEKKTEVILTISPTVGVYFRRRKLIAQQVIEKELEDGGLIISGKFAHTNQIFPIIRYWLPHVRIVSPESWQADLENELQTYLSR